jgi:RHS repeat-associated protein
MLAQNIFRSNDKYFFSKKSSISLYSYNGKEKDDEWNGTIGGALDFGARIYDSRIGRWMSLDPVSNNFPSNSPYMAFNSNPIYYLDPNGLVASATITAEPTDNNTPGTITVKANYIFYGTAVTTEEATSIAQKMQDEWNAANGTVEIGGKTYNVVFEVTGKPFKQTTENVSTYESDVKAEIDKSNNDLNSIDNYTRIEDSRTTSPKSSSRSFFIRSEVAGDNEKEQTAPHEFGHNLGLDDINKHTLLFGETSSPMMMARNSSLVIPKGGVNSKGEQIPITKILVPSQRKVTQQTDMVNLQSNLSNAFNGVLIQGTTVRIGTRDNKTGNEYYKKSGEFKK